MHFVHDQQPVISNKKTSTSDLSNTFPPFSSNSEALASELLENLEKMFLMYYMHSDMFSITNLQPHTGMFVI